jgi:hypothetical protein
MISKSSRQDSTVIPVGPELGTWADAPATADSTKKAAVSAG